jgi:RHS repeat-associated protein
MMHSVSFSYKVHTDHLGTPQIITDESQNVVWEADYEPFGEATITTELVTNNLRFRGQYFDEETGLHYNHHRTYSPEIGRYHESDPIGLLGGFNTYTYVGNNPIRFTDPLGLFKCPGGIWSATSDFSISLFLGGGITADDITYTCESNGKKCTATAFCFGGGAALTVGAGVILKGRVEGVTDSDQFNGFSSGFFIAGGPISTTITGSGGTTGLGKSFLIGAFAFVSCTNFHLRCDENGCE